MQRALPRKLGFLASLTLAGALAAGGSGCATITATATGALTGLVDGPAEVARAKEDTFRDHPEYWVLDVVVVAPLAAVFGPLGGFIKGIAVDVQWIRGEVTYGRAFGTYQGPSVWRPWTMHWEHAGSAQAVPGSSSRP
jgi:hypothetical protein